VPDLRGRRAGNSIHHLGYSRHLAETPDVTTQRLHVRADRAVSESDLSLFAYYVMPSAPIEIVDRECFPTFPLLQSQAPDGSRTCY